MIGCLTKLILFILDLLCINGGLIFSLLLRFDGNIEGRYIALYKKEYWIVSGIMLLSFYIFNLYKSVWRYASTRELLQIIVACFCGETVLFGVEMYRNQMFPKSVYMIFMLTVTFMLLLIRFSYRFLRWLRKNSEFYWGDVTPVFLKRKKKRVLIVGAGEAASIIIKDYNSTKKEIVVAVDDDKLKINSKINGVKIKGPINRLPDIVKAYNVEEIIVAMPSGSKKRISEILEICSKTDCELKIFPGIEKSIKGQNQNYIRPVKIEDLLGRDEVVINNGEIKNIIQDKVVLVTGGGGSIGSELCRQIADFKPKLLIIFDIYENTAYELFKELLHKGIPQDKLKVIVGSVRDKNKLEKLFKTYEPEIVFHAAAHKHVPLMEYSPEEAIKNNVFGTLNVALYARTYKVKKFILVSTDKAVNPTSVMGTTKRICEMIIQSINETTNNTDYVAVRFGNVLGSHGSVIPLFKHQIETGGPITVTHPDIIRYFMTIPEAVNLILQATSFATGGEIFVLDMGKPVKILDLAKNFIRLSGLEEGKDIQIQFTGLRPGEKLYEEILLKEEGLSKTSNEKIYIAMPGDTQFAQLLKEIKDLRYVLDDDAEIRPALKKIVPNYSYAKDEDYEQKAYSNKENVGNKVVI